MRTLAILFRFLLLATSVTICTAEVVLYDANGKAAASLDGNGQIWSFDGRPIGSVKGTPTGAAAVYSVEGKQTGWFKSGAFHGMDGKALWSVSARQMIATEVPPVQAVRQIAPIAPVVDNPNVAPVFSDEFATEPPASPQNRFPLILEGTAPVYAQFDPGTDGLEIAANALSSAQKFASIMERRQASEARAATHAREMSDGRAKLAALKQELEDANRELRRFEDRSLKSEEELAHIHAQREQTLRRLRAINTINAEPYGPIVAVEPVPELGLKQGDLIRPDSPSSDNEFVLCTIQDCSLEGDVWRHARFAFGAAFTRSSEPIEIIAERLTQGKLRKLGPEAYEMFLRESGERRERAFAAWRALSFGRFAVVDYLPEVSVGKGSVLNYLDVEIDGVRFSKQEIDGKDKELTPVALLTVMKWLDEGRIAATLH